MRAKLVLDHKTVDVFGGILQMVVWALPEPLPPSIHNFKYRLVYIRDGQRVIGFDNERGKGDHMHVYENEFPYLFAGLDQLIEDFILEVERHRSVR